MNLSSHNRERSAAKQRRDDHIRSAYARMVPLIQIARDLNTSVNSVKVTASRLGCTNKGEDIYALRRGFRVPAEKRADYDFLVKRIRFKSRRAARSLGIEVGRSAA